MSAMTKTEHAIHPWNNWTGPKRYAYVFCINNRVEWSSEEEESLRLRSRARTDRDRETIQEFIEIASVGSFIRLDDGDLIFRIQ